MRRRRAAPPGSSGWLANKGRVLPILQKSDEKEEGGASWIQWLVGEQGQSPSNSAEAEELRRCIQHLSCSTAALAEVFSVSMPGGESSERQSGALSGGSGGRAPERLETETGRVLTPHGRR